MDPGQSVTPNRTLMNRLALPLLALLALAVGFLGDDGRTSSTDLWPQSSILWIGFSIAVVAAIAHFIDHFMYERRQRE